MLVTDRQTDVTGAEAKEELVGMVRAEVSPAVSQGTEGILGNVNKAFSLPQGKHHHGVHLVKQGGEVFSAKKGRGSEE